MAANITIFLISCSNPSDGILLSLLPVCRRLRPIWDSLITVLCTLNLISYASPSILLHRFWDVKYHCFLLNLTSSMLFFLYWVPIPSVKSPLYVHYLPVNVEISVRLFPEELPGASCFLKLWAVWTEPDLWTGLKSRLFYKQFLVTPAEQQTFWGLWTLSEDTISSRPCRAEEWPRFIAPMEIFFFFM